MSDVARIPKGVETGGQFAASTRGEATGVTLRHLDGSFLYPPRFHSADEVIEFWSTVEIPDAALARAERSYAETWSAVTKEWPGASWGWIGLSRWEWDNPEPQDGTEEWEQRRDVARREYESTLREALLARPETLDRSDVRPMVRATAMMRSAITDLDANGEIAVSQHVISLSDGDTSVLGATERSGMLGLGHHFLDAERYDLVKDDEDEDDDETPQTESHSGITPEDVRRIVKEVVTEVTNDQNRFIDGAFDELTDDLGTAVTAVADVNDPYFGKKRRGRRS